MSFLESVNSQIFVSIESLSCIYPFFILPKIGVKNYPSIKLKHKYQKYNI